MKTCKTCDMKLENSMFRGLSNKCKYCEKVTYIKNRYGLTVEDYNRIYLEQDGRCAICGKHQSELKRVFFIDHDHTTGIVRGLLCSNCNTGIGQLGDSVQGLENALRYLKKNRRKDE